MDEEEIVRLMTMKVLQVMKEVIQEVQESPAINSKW